MRVCYTPGTVLGVENTEGTKAGKMLAYMEFTEVVLLEGPALLVLWGQCWPSCCSSLGWTQPGGCHFFVIH